MKYVFIGIGVLTIIGAIVYNYLKKKANTNLMPSTGSISKGGSSDTDKLNNNSGTPLSPINSSGVNLDSYIGYFIISGVQVAVFSENQFTELNDYPNAVGFLNNGTIVYAGMTNEGTPEETTYYYI